MLRSLKHIVILSVVLCLDGCKSSERPSTNIEQNETESIQAIQTDQTVSTLNAPESLDSIVASLTHQQRGFYVLMGQSNMSGHGELSELPDHFPKNASHLFNFTNAGALERAAEPIDDGTDEVYPVAQDVTAGVGPGLAFADAIYDYYPHVEIGLISCAKGGSSIDEWAPSESTDTLYGACRARIHRALEHATFLGVLWYQGESDTHAVEAVEAWPDKFKTIMNALREDVDSPMLPFSFAQLAVYDQQNTYWNTYLAHWDYMKQIQESLAVELQDDYVSMIRTDDLSIKEDGIHLDTASALEVGRRFASELAYYLTANHYD